jgi:hypothetical protein
MHNERSLGYVGADIGRMSGVVAGRERMARKKRDEAFT